jgi:hypothetical protein
MEAKTWYWDWDAITHPEIISKTEWPDGPWKDEPDQAQWPDEATGLPCLLRRHEAFGNLCGYVGVPEGHPWYRVYFPEINADVYGGVSFSDICHEGPEGHMICHVPEPGESDKIWWLGFSCGNLNDIQPGMDALLLKVGGNPVRSTFLHQSYKPVGFVKSECARLAAQIAAAG